jgi:hypothetical protein
VALGQFFWLRALKACPAGIINAGTSTQFLLNLVWAAMILGRLPTNQEYAGAAIVLASIVSGLVERRHHAGQLERGTGAKDVVVPPPPGPVEKEISVQGKYT